MAINKHVRFYIRNKKGTTPQPIYLSFYIDKQNRLFYPTGIKVNPKHWDNKMDRVKNVVMPELTVDNKHVHEMARYEAATKDNVNFYFSCLRTVVDKAISDTLKTRVPITKELLMDALNGYNNPAPALEEITFFKFIDQFISDLETGKRMLDGNKTADPKTIQRYKTAKNSLVEFEQHEKIKLTFDSWTEELWNVYISFLTFIKKFKINNVGFYQKQLKLFLKAARKAKLFMNDWLDDVKVLAENPIDVYLNKKELALIENHNLSGNDRLDRVRDLFLVGCHTGFRVSDWAQIKKENIKTTLAGNKYLEVVPTKANATPPSTPLQPIVSKILEKYNGVLPTISEQKFNQYLKELLELVKIDEEISIKYVIEGRVKIERVKKYSQVSSHTARRSFATNMYLDGIDSYLIMRATGHTTEKNFLKYLKLDNSSSIDAMADHKLKKAEAENQPAIDPDNSQDK